MAGHAATGFICGFAKEAHLEDDLCPGCACGRLGPSTILKVCEAERTGATGKGGILEI